MIAVSLPSHEAVRNWPGLTMIDPEGDTVGRITHIYLDRDSSQPEWALVAVPERGRVFVPLSDSGVQDDRVRVAVAKAAVRDAPEVPPGRELSERDEARLYSHYGAMAGQPDRGAKRAPSAGGRAKGAANQLTQMAGLTTKRLQGAGNRAREVATSAPAKRLLSAAGGASALGAAAAVVGRSGRPRRGGAATAPLRALGGLGTEIGRRTPAPPRPISRRRRSKMAGNFKLAVGLVSGYILGARAGRERYERLLEAARQVAERPGVQQLTDKVRTSLGAGVDKAASAAGDRLERARKDMGAHDEHAVDTVETAGQAEANQPPSQPSSTRSRRQERSRAGS